MNNIQLYSGAKLTTGSTKDPLLPKLIQAINHATEIEITVSFVQPSGLELLFDPLVDALNNSATIKFLTSDYLCITSPLALRKLRLLQERGANIRIFECKHGKSFHMKSYIFIKRQNGEMVEGCAWVGSNNISRTALKESHEWCLRHDFEPPLNSIAAVEFTNIHTQFEAIFNHQQALELTDLWINHYAIRHAQIHKNHALAPMSKDFQPEDIEPATPNSIQEQALIALCQTRNQGYKRGLVVLATGMGKTWLSAFDAKQLQAKKVLFVAHREEILLQAEKTFIQLTVQASTGLYNSQKKDADADYLFASIQTIGRLDNLKQFSPEHFDYIVIDEFHHACAPTYKNLLAYFQPQFLLGLTATPERSDQADILSLCDNNLVFERNLVHGIEEKILVPFNYHGIYDEFVNYEEIPWRNGRFDPKSLDNAFATQKRTAHIFHHWQHKKQTRTLAFCVSTKHADHMANAFKKKRIAAVAVYNGSEIRRNEALSKLASGDIDVLFSVDLFNEGTDIPAIDTILMLRPTESKILFLQQLGRGLRQSKDTNKTKLTVIDFIGNHHSFLNKPASLFNATGSKEVVDKIQQGITLAPDCYINYDPQLVDFWQSMAKRYRATAVEDYQELTTILGHEPTATEFFHHGYDLSKMRKQEVSWFNMVAQQKNDHLLNELVNKYGDFLLQAIESTSMTKCFKGILLEAFLELDGFDRPPTTMKLAERSWQVLDRRPDLRRQEIPEKNKNQTANSLGWHSYWKNNPIKAFTHHAKGNKQAWFLVENGYFKANFNVDNGDKNNLHQLMQELVDLRLAEYIKRLTKREQGENTTQRIRTNVSQFPSSKRSKTEGTNLPFYPNLKIACGHFKTGSHDEVETLLVPDGYGKLDPERHFIAPATGNSMNGGKNAIQNGDLLLFEWVTATSAGSISNLIMAIEIQDEAGDNQYLLRVIKKQSSGNYLLQAQNPDYEDKLATDQMRTFARLKAVIS